MSITQIITKLKSLDLNHNWQSVLEPWLRTELTYTSNSLEGNTLSFIETSLIINDNQGISGKNLREIYEATNHAKSWDYLVNNLKKLPTEDLTENHFLNIHSFILRNIDDYNAGKYRNVAVRISGSMTISPNPLKVSDQMSKTIAWLTSQNTDSPQNILNTAILTHLKLVKIHPFTDGNGRTVRLFMNTVLMQNGLPPIDILPINRQKYLEALENSTDDNPSQFLDFMLWQYDQNLDTYLETFN
jgi:Fic family protein